MPREFTTSYLKDATDLSRYSKRLGDRAMEQVPDESLFYRSRRGVKLDCHHREAPRGQHAFALDNF